MVRGMTNGVVVGIDISSEMIEIAKGMGGEEEINYMVGDCCKPLGI